jgi:hypothetical protein
MDSFEGHGGVVLGPQFDMGRPRDLAVVVVRHREALDRALVSAFATGLTQAAYDPKSSGPGRGL